MSKRRKRSEIAGGYDSFLDIVANLVGVLIILVVVLGARSHQIAQQIEEDTIPEASRALAEVESQTFARVSSDVERLEGSISAYQAEMDLKRRERSVLLQLLQVAKERWQEKLEELDDEAKQIAELERVKQLAEKELDRVSRELSAWKARPDETVAVEHLPTPMAQTVFGDEVHFRLKDGLIALVPLEELLKEVKEDIQRMASSGTGAKKSNVGPIREFVARYNLHLSRELVSRGGRVATMGRVKMAELIVEPLREPIGESIEAALKEDSQLGFELAGREPSRTTVTVWVYPESFAEFRLLKEHLYKLGFATAGRPLPKGYPISASPSGSRSQSQ